MRGASPVSRGEFERVFAVLLDELRALPWGEWTGKTEHTLPDMLHYLTACKERFFATLQRLPPEVFEARTCLEIGNAFFSAFMTERGARTVAVSRNLGMHGVWAATKGIAAHNVDVTQGLPFPSDSFDVIFYCEVMEHVLGYPEPYLAEMHRVLAPGGRLILTTPQLFRISNRVKFLLGRNIVDPLVDTSDGLRHVREFDIQELRGYLVHAGFRAPVITTFNHYESFLDRLVFQPWALANFRRKILAVCEKEPAPRTTARRP